VGNHVERGRKREERITNGMGNVRKEECGIISSKTGSIGHEAQVSPGK